MIAKADEVKRSLDRETRRVGWVVGETITVVIPKVGWWESEKT